MPISAQQKTIVITGCSSGFGRVTALHLAQQGWRVIATVRKEKDRASLIVEAAGNGCQDRLSPLMCDITNAEQVADLRRRVAAATPRLEALVNNAGTAFPAPLELLPPEELRAQLEVNVVGQFAVTQALLPLLKAARGTIVFVGSVSGRVALPVTGAYSASKFALEALSDAWRVELAPFGVRVVLMEPGSSPTGIWETSRQRGLEGMAKWEGDAAVYAPLIARVGNLAAQRAAAGFRPQLFADSVLKILNEPRPRARYPLPRQAAWLIAVRKFLPDALWDRQVRRMLNW